MVERPVSLAKHCRRGEADVDLAFLLVLASCFCSYPVTLGARSRAFDHRRSRNLEWAICQTTQLYLYCFNSLRELRMQGSVWMVLGAYV